jgi:hypothetical protein
MQCSQGFSSSFRSIAVATAYTAQTRGHFRADTDRLGSTERDRNVVGKGYRHDITAMTSLTARVRYRTPVASRLLKQAP